MVDSLAAPERLLRSPGGGGGTRSLSHSPVESGAPSGAGGGGGGDGGIHNRIGGGGGGGSGSAAAAAGQADLQIAGVVQAMVVASSRVLFLDYGDTIIARDGCVEYAWP